MNTSRHIVFGPRLSTLHVMHQSQMSSTFVYLAENVSSSTIENGLEKFNPKQLRAYLLAMDQTPTPIESTTNPMDVL